MKIEKIKNRIEIIINNRFDIEDNKYFDDIYSSVDEDLNNITIMRVKRRNTETNKWKTLILIEIISEEENDKKVELKKAITRIALIKESLSGTEATDLYLFLSFSYDVSSEECLRIESTEQICRKYVLFPKESEYEFVNRTFLQEPIIRSNITDKSDPLHKALSETSKEHPWFTKKIQEEWIIAFQSLSGRDLTDKILEVN